MPNHSRMRTFLKRAFFTVSHAMLWPIFRYGMLPTLTIGDRYEQVNIPLPLSRFGAPYQRAFLDYLEGPSTVDIASFEALEPWLRACAYVESPTRDKDWTARASQFEAERAGNCLDHALWAWRKLIELGYEPDLVLGIEDPNRTPLTRHAWVALMGDEERLLLETTEKRPDVRMLRGARQDVDYYWPEVGVRHNGERFGYTGMIRNSRRKAGLPWQDPGSARRMV